MEKNFSLFSWFQQRSNRDPTFSTSTFLTIFSPCHASKLERRRTMKLSLGVCSKVFFYFHMKIDCVWYKHIEFSQMMSWLYDHQTTEVFIGAIIRTWFKQTMWEWRGVFMLYYLLYKRNFPIYFSFNFLRRLLLLPQEEYSMSEIMKALRF